MSVEAVEEGGGGGGVGVRRHAGARRTRDDVVVAGPALARRPPQRLRKKYVENVEKADHNRFVKLEVGEIEDIVQADKNWSGSIIEIFFLSSTI